MIIVAYEIDCIKMKRSCGFWGEGVPCTDRDYAQMFNQTTNMGNMGKCLNWSTNNYLKRTKIAHMQTQSEPSNISHTDARLQWKPNQTMETGHIAPYATRLGLDH